MTRVTALDLKLMNKAVETVSKQGFNMVQLHKKEEPFKYSLVCMYGDTDEVYIVYVDAFANEIERVIDINRKEA